MLNSCHDPVPWQTLGIGIKSLWTNWTEFAKADMFCNDRICRKLWGCEKLAVSGHLRMEPWAFCWVWCIRMPRAVSFMVLRMVARAMFDMHFTNVWDWVKSFAWKHGESRTGSYIQTLVQRWAESFPAIRGISWSLDQTDLLLCKCGRSHDAGFSVYRTSCSSFQPYNRSVMLPQLLMQTKGFARDTIRVWKNQYRNL